MDGVPVYLASLSHYSPLTDAIVFVPSWPQAWRRDGAALLRALIGEMGDPRRERLFRMNVTLCLHRALREDEIARLPPAFWEGDPQAIAGAPVEVLWESIPGGLSTKPCARPFRMALPGYAGHPHGWIPLDCGQCPSCLARLAV
jgi:hypothetical protein